MATNKKKHSHPYPKKADVPASQRTRGPIVWGLLLGVFAALVAFLAIGANAPVLIIAAVTGAAIGYIIGNAMEKEAAGKK